MKIPLRSLRLVGLVAILGAGCSASQSRPPSPPTPPTSTPAPAPTPTPPSSPAPAPSPAPEAGEAGAEAGETGAEAPESDPAKAGGEPGEAATGSEPRGESSEEPGEAPSASGTTEASAGAGSSVETTGERHARLEGELDESLREFDGLILREQEVLEDRREASAEGSGAGGALGGMGTGAGTGELDTAESGRAADATMDGTGGSPDEAGVEPAGEPGSPETTGTMDPSMSGRVPPDVGDGSDDDIVARQLREAAMNEEDPELREKLWDEYRAYKFGEKKKPETQQESSS